MIDRIHHSRAFTRARQHAVRIFAFAVLISALGATSASARQTQEIDFEDAIGIAMENSVDIKRGANNVEAQEASVRSAQANFLPNPQGGIA